MSDLLGADVRGGVHGDLREVVKVFDGHLRADCHSVHLSVEAVQ